MIQSHTEDQDFTLFHLQKLSALRQRAAKTNQFVQRDVPPFDQHVVERGEREQRRSCTKTTVPAEKRAGTCWCFELGDSIRMSSSRRNPFEKGYVPKWTHAMFVMPTAPPTFEQSDKMGEPMKGKLYAHELQSVSPPESYQIEKIIRSQYGNDEK